MEEYRVVEIQGKHSMIYLHIPNRKPTKEDMKELYIRIARAIIMEEKFKACESICKKHQGKFHSR